MEKPETAEACGTFDANVLTVSRVPTPGRAAGGTEL